MNFTVLANWHRDFSQPYVPFVYQNNKKNDSKMNADISYNVEKGIVFSKKKVFCTKARNN